ncbi:MAG: DNA helicase, partial [Methylobacterium sp.]|nr:DNA helicase [Methylobacterium sp.]
EFEASARSPLPAPAQAGTQGFVPRLIRLPQPGLPALLQDMAQLPRPEQREERIAAEAAADSLEAGCGSLVHLYLEMLATQDLSAWTAARIADLQPAMQRWLQQQGHDAARAAEGASRVAGALQATLQSEAGRWVLQPRASAACELALVSYDGSRMATHVVDRTFVEDGCRWVIDYKSARLDQGASADAASALAERFRPQLERYARLFEGEGLPVRKAVFFIGSGRLAVLD